jgi:hypothetical protein
MTNEEKRDELIQRIGRRLVKLTNARWIVGTGKDNLGELGIRILGVNFWYYKWTEPMIVSESSYPWRFANKREFGDTIKSASLN